MGFIKSITLIIVNKAQYFYFFSLVKEQNYLSFLS